MRRMFATLAGLAAIATQAAIAGQAGTPQVEQHDGVRFVSGGIGIQERQAMDALSASLQEDFDTRIHLGTDSGHYLGGAEVIIRNAAGEKVLATRTRGPQLLVDLPEGNYTLEARNDGRSQGASFTVGSGNTVQPLYLTWAS